MRWNTACKIIHSNSFLLFVNHWLVLFPWPAENTSSKFGSTSNILHIMAMVWFQPGMQTLQRRSLLERALRDGSEHRSARSDSFHPGVGRKKRTNYLQSWRVQVWLKSTVKSRLPQRMPGVTRRHVTAAADGITPSIFSSANYGAFTLRGQSVFARSESLMVAWCWRWQTSLHFSPPSFSLYEKQLHLSWDANICKRKRFRARMRRGQSGWCLGYMQEKHEICDSE